MTDQQSEINKHLILQAVFGIVLMVGAMFLMSPWVTSSQMIPLLFFAVALLYLKDGLVLLVSAAINLFKSSKP